MQNTDGIKGLYGYQQIGFCMAKVDGTDIQSVIEDDGIYVKSLKFFFDANQRGLIDRKTKQPERVAEFIDWLYSPEGVRIQGIIQNYSCGPEGLTWELQDGKPVFTEFGVEAFVDNKKDWSQHYGGALNTIDLLSKENKMLVLPGTNYAVPEASTDITTIKEQCKQIIVEYSWMRRRSLRRNK